ncbi:hypothetical protein C5167_013401, partial [Papaver somniferum]
ILVQSDQAYKLKLASILEQQGEKGILPENVSRYVQLAVMEMESVKENMFSARYQRRMSAARVDTGKNDCFHERYLSCGCSHYRRRKELGKEQRMVLIIMMIGRDRMMMMTARG